MEDYFYLTNDDTSTITISITKHSGSAPTVSLEVSDNGTSWTTLGDTSETPLSFTIPVGGRKYIRSTSKNAWTYADYNSFSSTGRFGAHGSIMALLGYDTLKGYDCYRMFDQCANLTTAPELPATTTAALCYDTMFSGCTSLTTPPLLPATTLERRCYYGMFQGCTGITKTPVLPATVVPEYGYQQIFANCSLIDKVICLATDISTTHCLSAWLISVADTGTLYKDSSTTYDAGMSGIPDGWTSKNIQ